MSLDAMAAAAIATAEQFIEVLSSAPDPKVPVRVTRPWTVTDVAGHIAMQPGRFRDLALGSGRWAASASELPDFNKSELAILPSRDIAELVALLRRDLQAFLALTAELGDGAIMMFDGGGPVDVRQSIGLLIAEFVIHGRDIARTTRSPWIIDPSHVPLMLAGLHQVMPSWVNPRKAAGHTGTYQLDLRGGPTYTFNFTDGQLSIDNAGTNRVDVCFKADPVAWLLLTYGRESPVMPVLTGKVRISGRRPWLALRFSDLFLPA